MFLYWLIIFIYPILNVELKEIKIKKSFLFFGKDINNKIINKDINYININIMNNDLSNSTDMNETFINKTISADDIFREDEYISFCFLFFGFFIILYGAYYYKLALIIHSSLFLFYAFILILPNLGDYYQLILFFSCISGILIYKFITTDDKSSKKYITQKILYGFAFGCFLIKIIFYYYILFKFISDNNFNENIDDINTIDSIYTQTFISFILIFGVISCFLPDILSYISCSTISGSFYIINNLDFIINMKIVNNKYESFITSIIIQVIIIICSIIFQIYHLKYKESEVDNIYINEKNENDNDNSRISNVSIISNSNQDNELKQGIGEKEQKFLFNEREAEEEEINDQED